MVERTYHLVYDTSLYMRGIDCTGTSRMINREVRFMVFFISGRVELNDDLCRKKLELYGKSPKIREKIAKHLQNIMTERSRAKDYAVTRTLLGTILSYLAQVTLAVGIMHPESCQQSLSWQLKDSMETNFFFGKDFHELLKELNLTQRWDAEYALSSIPDY